MGVRTALVSLSFPRCSERRSIGSGRRTLDRRGADVRQSRRRGAVDGLRLGALRIPSGGRRQGGSAVQDVDAERFHTGWPATWLTGCARYIRPRAVFPTACLRRCPCSDRPRRLSWARRNPRDAPMRNGPGQSFTSISTNGRSSFPDIFDRMAALDLAGDDRTGMWMLNYAFPYWTGGGLGIRCGILRARRGGRCPG